MDGSLENLSSLGFFLETLVKFKGTRNALSQVVFSVGGNFCQLAQLGLPNRCWLFAVDEIKAKVKNKQVVMRRCMTNWPQGLGQCPTKYRLRFLGPRSSESSRAAHRQRFAALRLTVCG